MICRLFVMELSADGRIDERGILVYNDLYTNSMCLRRREVMAMKNISRWLSALLAVTLLLVSSLAAVADDTEVYIPNRIEKLQLPDRGEKYKGDPFLTGMEGAVTYLERESTVVKAENGKDARGRIKTKKVTLKYISKVTTVYPEGNYIRKVVAEYGNDKKKSLTKYTITYQVGEKQQYTVSYAPKTNTVVEDHASGKITFVDHGVHTYTNVDTGDSYTVDADANLPSTTLFKDSLGGVYLHHYDQDEILEAFYTDGKVDLKSGSGDNANAWYSYDVIKGVYVPAGKGGLRAPKSFKSPRVQ